MASAPEAADARFSAPISSSAASAFPASAARGRGMDRDGLRPRGRFWWPWLLLPIIGALVLGSAALVVRAAVPSRYTAETLVSVLPTSTPADVSLPVAAIFAQVSDSEAVLRVAARALRVDESELASAVKVSKGLDAPLVSITVTTDDPTRAATWANGVAAALLAQGKASPVPGYALTQVTPAIPPITKSTLVSPWMVLAAVALGGVLGGLAAQSSVSRRRRAMANR